MALIRISSPHTRKPGHAGNLMREVLLATLPGLAALCWFFGWGSLINVLLACVLALAFESLVLLLRRRPLGFYLRDGSALVTAVLLGLALPPYVPWWVTLVGIFFAIVIAKHLYGGMGYNPFNPAMVAYALLLISFPVQMTQWTAPGSVAGGLPSLGEALGQIFAGQPLADAYTMATPLDAFKHKGALTAEEFWSANTALATARDAGFAVSLAFLAGGAYLIWRKVFTWHTPVALLATLFLLSAMAYGSDPSNYASPLFHLTTGAAMLGAFFIATDPVTAATSNRGKLIFGACIGALIFVIRTFGNYPDGVAFAVLLMNLSAPFLDYYTQPRTYGHKKSNRGIKG